MPMRPQNPVSPESKLVGDFVRSRRLAAALTQEELASRSKLSMRHVSLIETGKTNPTVPAVGRLLRVLGVPWAELAAILDTP